MAKKTFVVTIETVGVSVAGAQPPGTAPSSATVAADIATLVADAASPTQAHVTALNGHWATFLAAQNTFVANIAAGGVVVSVDSATVLNLNQLKAAFDAIYQQFAGTDFLAKG